MLCLSVENDSLKQSLSVTQGLLQQLSAIPSQSSNMLLKVITHTQEVNTLAPPEFTDVMYPCFIIIYGIAASQCFYDFCVTKYYVLSIQKPTLKQMFIRSQENESLRGRIQQLETSLQERAEQLSHLERQSEKGEWRRGEELRKREDRVRELQLELDRERGKEPLVKVSHDLCELSRAFCVSMLSMNPWMCPSGQKKHLQ